MSSLRGDFRPRMGGTDRFVWAGRGGAYVTKKGIFLGGGGVLAFGGRKKRNIFGPVREP